MRDAAYQHVNQIFPHDFKDSAVAALPPNDRLRCVLVLPRGDQRVLEVSS
jgi:hypothetical protein